MRCLLFILLRRRAAVFCPFAGTYSALGSMGFSLRLLLALPAAGIDRSKSMVMVSAGAGSATDALAGIAGLSNQRRQWNKQCHHFSITITIGIGHRTYHLESRPNRRTCRLLGSLNSMAVQQLAYYHICRQRTIVLCVCARSFSTLLRDSFGLHYWNTTI